MTRGDEYDEEDDDEEDQRNKEEDCGAAEEIDVTV